MSADTKIALSEVDVIGIRKALLIGLECFGELERLHNAVEVLELCKKSVPEEDHMSELRSLRGALTWRAGAQFGRERQDGFGLW